MKLKIDKKTQVEILGIIDEWMFEHWYQNGASIYQNYGYTINCADLVLKLGDIYSELYESQSE